MQFKPSVLRLVTHVNESELMSIEYGSGKGLVNALNADDVISSTISNNTITVRPVASGSVEVLYSNRIVGDSIVWYSIVYISSIK